MSTHEFVAGKCQHCGCPKTDDAVGAECPKAPAVKPEEPKPFGPAPSPHGPDEPKPRGKTFVVLMRHSTCEEPYIDVEAETAEAALKKAAALYPGAEASIVGEKKELPAATGNAPTADKPFTVVLKTGGEPEFAIEILAPTAEAAKAKAVATFPGHSVSILGAK